MEQPLESDAISEMTEEEQDETFIVQHAPLSRFIRFDLQYLFPLFTHRFSRTELRDYHLQMSNLANQWLQSVRSSGAPSANSTQSFAMADITDPEMGEESSNVE